MLKIIIGGLMFIYIGIDTYVSGVFIPYFVLGLDLGYFKIPVSMVFLIFGIFIIYSGYMNNWKDNTKGHKDFTKCPKCKINYAYADLKKGICPKCNIETIEIDEYYKKYQEELKDV